MSDQGSPPVTLVVGRGLYALQLCRVHHSTSRVLLATTAHLDYTPFSLSVSQSFRVPKPVIANDAQADNNPSVRAFSEALQRIILEHKVNLVVPAAEEALFVSYLYPT
jgi:hypothetical protein